MVDQDRVAYKLTRELLRASDPDQVCDVLVRMVESLGGRVTDDTNDPDVFELDLSLGLGPPQLAAASDPKTRSMLADFMPAAVVDARIAIARLRRETLMGSDPVNDALTGLATRAVVERVLARVRPEDAVAYLDLDGFTLVNQELGRAGGDQVLAAFAGYLRQALRADDLAGRIGGEEFVLVLRDCPLEQARIVLARIATAWERTGPFVVSFSAGVTCVGDEHSRMSPAAVAGELLASVQEALRHAKDRGPAAIELRGPRAWA